MNLPRARREAAFQARLKATAAEGGLSQPAEGNLESLTADTRQDRELRDLCKAVRALTDRVAQLEARLAAGADPGVDHPRRPRSR